MDHEAVVREKMTERYLLNELDPGLRDEFEDHYFDCPECARDICAGSQFVQHTKFILGESTDPVSERSSHASQTENPERFAWLPAGLRSIWFRPIWTVPALALLLIVIGYQNLVTYPQLRGQPNQPRVLPWAAVAVGTWGAGPGSSLSVRQGAGFLLIVRIPPDGAYSHYQADLYNPQGRLECSTSIPANAGQDQWPVQFPGASRESGIYKLSVHGVTAAGESKDLGSATVELKIQN